MIHEEIDDPRTYNDVPYALKVLLDTFKAQYMNYINTMRSTTFKENLNRQIESEKEKNKRLMNRTGQLEKQIKVLVDDSVILLKARMQELGINTSSQNDLLCKAKEIVGKHKELQLMATKIQNQVNTLEEENNVILATHMKKLAEKQQKQPIDFELASKESHELVLKEIENVLNQRKTLKSKISTLEAHIATIEKANEDKRVNPEPQQATEQQQKPHQQGIYVSGNIYKSAPPSKGSRKSREHRQKTHEWPEIPEIGKIEENNPEILAQKILETGRQIEAGKFSNLQQPTIPPPTNSGKKQENYQTKKTGPVKHEQSGGPMSAPVQKSSKTTQQSNVHQGLPKAGGSSSGKKGADSHKVVNFEDRLKSIITSALQGQDQLKGRVEPPPLPSPQQQQLSPAPMQQQPQPPSPKKIVQMQHQQNFVQHNMQVPPPSHLHVPIPSISPSQTSPVKRHMVPLPQMAPHLPGNEHFQMQQRMEQESTYAQLKRNEHLPNFAKAMNPMNLMHAQNDTKMFQRHPQMQQQSMQQQQQYLPREREPPVQMIYHQRSMVEEKREFKTPDNIRYERQDMGRSSVGSIENEYINCGGSSSSGKSQTQRSSSSLSQPDYTQVSPAKLALRRHLSQEKLAQHSQMPPTQIVKKTIGDFINAEIEKTLEITPQSIINAVIQHNIPSHPRMQNESLMSMRDEREMNDQHPYATIKPSSSKQQQQQFMHDPYSVDHRQKMMPMKYASASTARKSAISSPTQQQLPRHEEPINFMSLPPKSSPQDRIHHQEATSSSRGGSYKIDTKVFTSNIGMSMRKELEMKDREREQQHDNPPLEGLAATLMMRHQAISSMKIKEEADEPKYSSSYQHVQLPYPHIIKKECEFLLVADSICVSFRRK